MNKSFKSVSLKMLLFIIIILCSDLYSLDSLRITLIGRALPGPCAGVSYSGGRLYVGSGGMFAVINLTYPSSPTIQGKCFVPGAINDVFVSGSYAYVAAGSAGLRVINISNPFSPYEVGRYTDMVNARGVYVRSDTCFVTMNSEGLAMLSVRNPASPSLIRRYTTSGTAEGVFDIPGISYVADGDNGFWIRRHSTDTTNYYYNVGGYAVDLYVVGNNAYVSGQDAGMVVLNKSNPTSISELGFYPTFGDANDIYVSGNYGYLASGWDGFYILNLSNPAYITELSAISITGEPFHLTYSSPYVYLADKFLGLYVINVSAPSNPNITGRLALRGEANRLALSGNYLYIAHNYGGLRIVDISTLSNPIERGVNLSYTVYGVGVNGNFAYTACGTSGMRIFDVTDRTYPIEAGNFDYGGNITDVAVRYPYVYVTDKWFGLYSVNVTNALVPDAVGSLSGYNFLRVYSRGNYAYVSAGLYGWKIVNIQDPTRLTLVSTYLPQGQSVLSSYVSGNYAYLAEGGSGLEVLNISNPASPVSIGFYASSGYVEDVIVSGNFAFLASGTKGLEVLRVDNPYFPRLVGYYDTGDYGMSLVVRSSDTTVFFADSWDGLWIFDAGDIRLGIDGNEVVPYSIELLENYPNPFNPSTRIKLNVNKKSKYELTVYNILGQKVKSLYNGNLEKGFHYFNWIPDNDTPSGTYFITLSSNGESLTRKTILLK